jgi:hypothetical protein
MDYEKVTKAYLAIRDKRHAIKRAYETEDAKLKADLTKLEAVMLRHLNDTGLESAKTTNATFYKQEELKPSASDWQAFYDWIKENDAFDALERRIKTAFVKEHMEVHDGALPPGVSIHREYAVRVRRAQ